jgi:DNA polymerase V
MQPTEPDHYVGLIDCNNFFVSCERLFRPDLRTRPVLVLSSNDGCVVARSQEVKDMGIPMGVPYFQIKDIIKDNRITVFSSNFTLYRDISRRIFSVVRDICPTFEQYSIDEGFFLVSASEAEALGWRIKDSVARTLGMPVSVGLAASKTLAKYASARAKSSRGVAVVSMSEWVACAPSVGLGALWGVGPGRLRAFTEAGLCSAADLMAADTTLVRRRFGVEGARLQLELLGTRAYPVAVQAKQQQSIMHSRSFKAATQERAVVAAAVAYHVRRAVEDLEAMGLCARFLTVAIRSSRYESRAPGWGSETLCLPVPTANMFVLMNAAQTVLSRLYRADVAYQKAGIVLSGLLPTNMVSAGTLWGEGEASERHIALSRAVATLNQRFGSDAVQLGYHAPKASWHARQDVLSPAYTTRWSALARVQAR